MVRALEKIKSLEEYELKKEELKYYVSEYKWFSESKDPKKEVEEEWKSCNEMLHPGLSKEETGKLEERIWKLNTKYDLIREGTYKSALKRNITSLILSLEQFEAANQNISFIDLVKGIISGGQEVKEYFRKKYMFTLSDMYGTAYATDSLNVESLDKILDYMAKNYDFVDIDLSDIKEESKEVALTLFEEPVIGIKAELSKRANDYSDRYIGEFGNEHLTKNTSSTEVKSTPREISPIHVNKKVNPNQTKDAVGNSKEYEGEVEK